MTDLMRVRWAEPRHGIRVACLAGLLCLFGQARGQEDQPGGVEPRRPHILFIGFHERAFPALSKATLETGIKADKLKIVSAGTPERVKREMERVDYSRYDLVFILQINAVEAHLLAGWLGEAERKNPKLRVVQLDHRDTQQELLDTGIMKVDPEVTRYWKSFTFENLKRLLVYSNVKYLGGDGEVLPPIPAPQSGLYHPDAPTRLFGTWAEYLTWSEDRAGYQAEAPLVAVVVQYDYAAWGNSAVYDAVIRELERNGINVAAMFGGQEDLQRILRSCRPSLMMLQHHSGPEDIPAPGQRPFLEELDVPYMYTAGLLGGTTIGQWKNDLRGTRGGTGYDQLHRHEMHGIIEPMIVGAREPSGLGYDVDRPIPERVRRLVGRAKSWLVLRSKPASAKKVAIFYSHKYLGKASIGHTTIGEMARYFDVHKSLVVFLRAMKDRGYTIGRLPASAGELVSWMKSEGRNVPSWAPGSLEELVRKGGPELIPLDTYLAWFNAKLSPKNRNEIVERYGEPPGKFMVVERDGAEHIVLPVIRLGNVILGPHPALGDIQDNRLMHEKKIPPPHNYLAYYWWLQEGFKADALIHFCTFASDIFLPGKEVFLSGECYPDIVIGDMPHLYTWSISCIGIGVIAKRRAYSVLVDYGVPPIVSAGLDPELGRLQEKIYQFNQVRQALVREEYRRTLTERAGKLRLVEELRLPLAEGRLLSDAQIVRISGYLEQLQEDNVPKKMHVLGTVPPDDEAIPFVAHIVRWNTGFFEKLEALGIFPDGISNIDRSKVAGDLLADLLVRNMSDEALARRLRVSAEVFRKELKPDVDFVRNVWRNLQKTGQEITNFLAALEGRYVPPGPGGTPIQRPEVLPTGRNLYGLSPDTIPTTEAWAVARQLTDSYLQGFRAQKGRYPKRVAFQLTGMQTFLDMGVLEAQILYLIGVRPRWSPGGIIKGFEPIPSAELKRPRIDPFVSIGGIYLKDFPSRVHMLDEAIQMANGIAEEDNYLRSNSAEIEKHMRSLGTEAGRARELSTARIFGAPPGQSGVRLIWYIPRSGTWDTRLELLEVRRMLRTHVYTRELWGDSILELHDRVIQGREVVFSNWGNNLYGPLTNHHYPEETGGLALEVERTGGIKPEIVIQDLRKKKKPRFVLLEDVLNMEMRSTFFNKEWIAGQMAHDYTGATQFMSLADHVYQWEAVREGAIWPENWVRMAEVYVHDCYDLKIREWFDRHNPHAFQEFVAVMLEGARKGFWTPSEELMRELVHAYAASVAEFGLAESAYTGGNKKLQDLVGRNLDAPSDRPLLEQYQAEVARSEVPAAGRPEVEGPQLREQTPEATSSVPGGTDRRLTHVFILVGVVAVLFLLGMVRHRRSRAS